MIRKTRRVRRFTNRPLALLPSAARALLDSNDGPIQPGGSRRSKSYDVVEDVAIIEISGILVHDFDPMIWDYQTAYRAIQTQFVDAIGDDTIDAVCLLVNSPGGDCQGCFDLSDRIFDARGAKPIWAICDEDCYSAAYAIASAADKIVLPRTGGCGSIGVIAQCVSLAGALEQAGIEVTTFTYGDRKADGNPSLQMTDAAASRIQADIDDLGELFVGIVARNRGIDADDIRDMQAATFRGQKGVDAGLADEVAPPDAAFQSLIDELA